MIASHAQVPQHFLFVVYPSSSHSINDTFARARWKTWRAELVRNHRPAQIFQSKYTLLYTHKHTHAFITHKWPFTNNPLVPRDSPEQIQQNIPGSQWVSPSAYLPPLYLSATQSAPPALPPSSSPAVLPPVSPICCRQPHKHGLWVDVISTPNSQPSLGQSLISRLFLTVFT